MTTYGNGCYNLDRGAGNLILDP